MNIGIILENHRWYNILDEHFQQYTHDHNIIYNMDHEFMRFDCGGNTVWVTVAMGASIAVSMAEKLIQDFECKRIIRIGTAGSLVKDIKIGDITCSYAGIKGEGTSSYYLESEIPAVGDVLKIYDFCQYIKCNELKTHMVMTFTTDGRWKENPAKIARYVQVGAKTIDMESSALLSMGMDRGVDSFSLSIVSDSPLDDEGEFIGLIKEGVWENVIMIKFVALFDTCLRWCSEQ